MRILVVCPHVPYPLNNGGSIRAFKIAEGLSRRHHIHLLAIAQETPSADVTAALRAISEEVTVVQHHPNRIANVLRGVVKRPYALQKYWAESIDEAVVDAMTHCDVALFNSLHTAQYARTAWPCVLDSHNVEHVQWRRWGQVSRSPFVKLYCQRQGRMLERWQVGVADAMGAIFACSTLDASILGPKSVLAPNGVEIGEPMPRNPEPATFLFVGDMGWRPNADAARQLARYILPEIHDRIPEARVEIVGRQSARLARAMEGTGLHVVGPVESVAPYLARATAAVVPLRTGSGTRLKILEAFAAGVPVVSTMVGCEGLHVVDGEHLLIADSIEGFADACARIATDAELAATLSANGRKLVETAYTWETTVGIVEETCGIVAARGAQ